MGAATLLESRAYGDLVREIREGNVVAFVGAGVSQAAGLPGWAEIAKRLAADLAKPEEDPRRLLDRLGPYGLLEVYAAERSPHALGQIIRRMLEVQHNTEIQELLLKIPFHLIVTTNWDTLFEEAGKAPESQELEPVVTKDEHLRGCYGGRNRALVKPHGTIGSEIVATQSAVSVFDAKYPGLSAFVQSLFFTHRVLFIGYSFGDPDFLRFHNLYIRYLGTSAARSWAKHLVVSTGANPAQVSCWKSMNLEVLECEVGEGADQTAALRDFLRDLAAKTDPIIKEKRASRIGDFLQSELRSGEVLRVRAGLTPLGIPDEIDEAEAPKPWSRDTYEDLQGLKEAFKQALHKAREVKVIVSADFESLQDRTERPDWARQRLSALIEFFEGEDSELLEKIRVVDRRSPYEIEQYIVDDRCMIDSRKYPARIQPRYETEVVCETGKVERAIKVYDSCFESFVFSNFCDLLQHPGGAGRDRLIAEILDGRDTGSHLAVLDQSKATSIRRELQQADESRRSRVIAKKLPANVLRYFEGAVHEAIRAHLLQLWHEDLERLRDEERTPHAFIRLQDREQKDRGYVDKRLFHESRRYVRDDLTPEEDEESLRNLHVAGFVFTSDGRRLVLRRRSDEARFDPGKWDRTICGHVRMHSNYADELRMEVPHHFGSGPTRVEDCEFVDLPKFTEELTRRQRSRQRGARGARMQRMVVAPVREPVDGTYKRSWPDSGAIITEHAFTMSYMCLLPTPQLPEDWNAHFAGWAEIELKELGKLSRGQSAKARVTLGGNSRVHRIGAGQCTDELLKLLQDVLRYLSDSLPKRARSQHGRSQRGVRGKKGVQVKRRGAQQRELRRKTVSAGGTPRRSRR